MQKSVFIDCNIRKNLRTLLKCEQISTCNAVSSVVLDIAQNARPAKFLIYFSRFRIPLMSLLLNVPGYLS